MNLALGSSSPAQKRTQEYLAVLPVIILKTIFLISYPLNISGDGYNYYTNMLLPGRAMLVHAGGYPFLWGLLLHNFDSLVEVRPVLFELIFVASQHLFDLFCLVVLYKTTRYLFGPWLGIFALYFSGLSIFYLSAVSTTNPEWLQGDLWILFTACLVHGLLDNRRKNPWLICSVILFYLAYIVKFNSLILVLFYLPVLVIEKSRKALSSLFGNLLLGTAFAIAFHLVYLIGYHYPTTGTYKLHYDSGWVLSARVNSLISVNNGINTKRMFALNGSLPEKFNYEPYFVDLFKHINAVPVSERSQYNEIYEMILGLDERQLDDYLVLHPPWNTDQYYNYVLRVQYYIGLEEGNNLGVKMAYEAIKTHPTAYLESVVSSFLTVQTEIWRPFYLPNMNDLNTNARLRASKHFGYYLYNVPYYSWNQLFRTNQNTSWFWRPGLEILRALSISVVWPTLSVILAGLALSIYRLLYYKNMKPDLQIFLFLVAFVFLFDLASNIVLVFRSKELHAVLAFIGVCTGFGIKQIFEFCVEIRNWIMFAKQT